MLAQTTVEPNQHLWTSKEHVRQSVQPVDPIIGELPRPGKSQGKTKIFQGQGKPLLLSKSASEGIIFSGYSSYVLHGDGEMHLVRKRMKSTLQSEQSDLFLILSAQHVL